MYQKNGALEIIQQVKTISKLSKMPVDRYIYIILVATALYC